MQLKAKQSALEYLEKQAVYLDTETTGLGYEAEIIEICILDNSGIPLIDTMVRPCQPIPWQATRINGIHNHMVDNAPTWREIWPAVKEALNGRYVGIYNAEFDLRMIRQSHTAHSMRWSPPEFTPFCIMRLYSQYCNAYYPISLKQAGCNCNISLPNAHRSLADTLLAREILNYIARY